MSDDLDFGATVRGFVPEQKVFGRYLLRKILGRGGMGVVWLAYDEELEREIAMKFLPEVVANDKQSIKDLKRETRRSLELTHPHIIRIYDFVQDSNGAGISMEYVTGDTLASLKVDQPNGHFEVAQLTPWLEQLCRALDYAHLKAKVVHRDLKPANLMIDDQGDLKIADFGIAASVSDSVSRVSNQAGSSGTPVYMSPQQMMGEEPAPTDDVYALGATLFELLTSKPPFYSGNVMMQVMNKQPPTMAARRVQLEVEGDDIPAVWEEVITACLAKEREDRPAGVAELLERLTGTKLKSLSTVKASPLSPAVAPPTPPPVDTTPSSMPDPLEAPDARPSAATEPPPSPKQPTSIWGKVLGATAVLALVAFALLVYLPKSFESVEKQQAAEDARRQAESQRERERETALAETQAALGLDTAPVETSITAVPEEPAAPPIPQPTFGEPWVILESARLLPVAAGSFTMGSPPSEFGRRDNEVPREITITSDFWLGSTEVTQGQWREVMGTNPSAFPGLGDQAPVENVSYDDVGLFLERINARESAAGRLPDGYRYALPTEAQWEFAARAGSATAYHWGDRPDARANFENAPGSSEDGNVAAFNREMDMAIIASTHPVGTWEPNAWGFHDMHGNVWEWCSDAYQAYDPDDTVDPVVIDAGDPERVYRGGSWYHAARYSRSAARSFGPKDFTSNFLGFRLALTKQPAG